jgi:hypothetical protein
MKPGKPPRSTAAFNAQAFLIDQLFNSSEKRLARALLLLARYGKQDKVP